MQTPSKEEMKLELVPVTSIKPYPLNPHHGNVEIIRESLRKNGQYRPVVVRTSTREVLAGNHTLKAVIEEGESHIWVTYHECDDETAKRINLVDNRAPELGGYDGPALIDLLGSLPDLEGTGWTSHDLAGLLLQGQDQTGLDPPEREDPLPSSSSSSAAPAVVLVCPNSKSQQDLLVALTKVKANTGTSVELSAALQDVQLQLGTI